MLVFTGWQAWMSQQEPDPVAQELVAEGLAGEEGVESGETRERVAEQTADVDRRAAEERAIADAARRVAERPPAAPGDTPDDLAEQLVAIEGDLFEANVSSRGGTIQSWRLTDYTQTEEQGGAPTELINHDGEFGRALQTPFDDLGVGNLVDAVYEVEARSPESVTFALRRGGMVIRKHYAFDLTDYRFDLSLSVENNSSAIVAPKFTVQWPAVASADDQDFREQALIVRDAGEEDVDRELVAGIGSPGFFATNFMGASPDGRSNYNDGVDWAGIELKYFVSVLLPPEPRNARALIEPIVKNEVGLVSVNVSPMSVEPGAIVEESFAVYMGPKEVARFEAMGSNLLQTINLGYSWFEPLTMFFRWLLPWCYGYVGNYGIAIILITLAVRILTMPIMARQMKSMERMRELQPRMKEIQEKHKDDKQKQSEATMALYKETGVNPLGGCFPMLLQFPVFIGLFFALQSSIELRHAPFALWITDLSSPESLFTIPGIDIPIRLLPLIMGGSMVIQQRMTPQTGMDPAQAKMMMTVMPIMMTVLFYQFPSGLVLYWMMSNLLGIGHQLWVRRNLEAAKA
jgi:YidC/Oxa1 family membrane protein insertase